MGIVRFALRFPHTFYVLAALILFLGVAAIRSMPTDIFPEIRIPVVTVIWQYTGLTTPEMEQRVSTYSQYSISANVNGIKNMEVQTLNGLSIQKIYFQPDVNLDLAIAQIVSATNSIRALMPPGIQPPIVVQFNASSVPVLQLSLNSDSLNEQQLYDFGIYRVRQQLAPVPGVTLPTPAGGKYRQIMVDIDPDKLLSRGLTPLDIVNAVNTQNLTLPSGTAKIGDTQYTVRTNATPASINDLNMMPVKFADGATILLKDVAQVRDGSMVQQNIVRENGHRSVLLSVIKNGNASTLAVVNGVKKALEVTRAAAPAGLKINELFDQSVFVTNSVTGVLREGAIAAGLTALMILIFLGSWRSTLVVMISIPLAILSSLVVLYFLGETLNTMTLGGLALAVGILVDDSTVTIENTHRLWTEEGMPLSEATLHGAAEIAVPTLVSTLAISCVFTSVVFLDGPAKYLFTPLGLAVVFAMLASYGLSRTLTPITIGLLLRSEHHGTDDGTPAGIFSRISAAFDRSFERLRDGYRKTLTLLLRRRAIVPVVAVLILGLGAGHTSAEWTMTGSPYPSPAQRVGRFAEMVHVVTSLLRGDVVTYHGRYLHLDDAFLLAPRPVQSKIPLLIGGNGTQLLRDAGRAADIVSLTGLGRTLEDGHRHTADWSPAAIDVRVGIVREVAPQPEHVVLDALVQHVEITDHRVEAAERHALTAPGLTTSDVLDAPYALIGTLDQIVEELTNHRERWGFTSYVVRADALDLAARLVERTRSQ